MGNVAGKMALRKLVLAALAVSTFAFTDKAEHKELSKAEKKIDLLQSLERVEPAEAGKPSKPFFYPFYPMTPLKPEEIAKYTADWTEAVKKFYASPMAWYFTWPWWSMWWMWMWPYMGYYMWAAPWMWMWY